MSAQTANSQLRFHTFESGYHYAHGILTDKVGNTFRVEIKGLDVDEVKKHMNYFVRKTRQGKGISALIKQLSAREHREIRQIGKSKNEAKATKHRKRSFPQDVTITINVLRYMNKINARHHIHFTIDPDIKLNASATYPISFTPQVSVSCNVTMGKVRLKLIEYENENRRNGHVRGDTAVLAGKTGGFSKVPQNRYKNSIGNSCWDVIVTGLTQATYQLSLNVIANG